MCALHYTPHKPSSCITYSKLSHNIEHDVKRVPRALLQPPMPQALRKDSPLLCIAQNPASVPLLTFARKHVWMALHALAQCTARLLLAHQQKQGRQWAGITSLDNEEDGMRKDWSVYCALADLGMEERVKGGRCVCPVRPQIMAHCSTLSCVSRHSSSQGCTMWNLTVLHGKLRIEPSRRRFWRHQIRFSRKSLPSC
jgi:hypothetical protein